VSGAEAVAAPEAPPLTPEQRALGRRLAIGSHPAGNTFRLVFTQHLPTLALVALGASELWVGVQSAFVFVFILLQLPTMRLMARIAKRRILIGSHLFALLAAAPLVGFGTLETLPGAAPLAIAMTSFALVAIGICIGETVWFPLLRAYVEPDRIGRFFGVLRTGWHLALILFYLGSLRWLEAHPGAFAPLFAVGWGLGFLRIFALLFLPERSERTGERIRVREAFARAEDPRIRRYLVVASATTAARMAAIPFVIVMLRRVVGLEESDVLATTAAHFAGGLASLYLWGRVVDRVGAVAVWRATAVGHALLLAPLVVLPIEWLTPAVFVAWFFALAVTSSGFGVADTQLLFGLAPPSAPARTLVLGAVVVGILAGVAPIFAGGAVTLALERAEPLAVYRALFAALTGLSLVAVLGLRKGPFAQRP
jgi:MFS family permease